MPPLLIKEEIYAMDSSDDSDNEPMSTKMLEDNRDGSQSHQIDIRREAHYKILACIKQRQM